MGGIALGPAGHEGAPRYRSPDALAGAAWGRLTGRCRTLSCGLWGRRAPPGGEARPGTRSKQPGAGAGGKVEFTACDRSLFRESPGPFGDRGVAAKEVCAAGPGSERSVATCPRAATGGKAARLGWLAALRAPQPTEGRSRGRAGLGQAEWGRPRSPRWKPEDRAWRRAALSWRFWRPPEAGSRCRPVCPRRFYRSWGKKERGGLRIRRRGPGSPGVRQGSAGPDRTRFEGCAHRFRWTGDWGSPRLWSPFWSEVVNAPTHLLHAQSRAHALCTRGCPATLPSLTSQGAGENRVWVLAPAFRILQTLCLPGWLGQLHLGRDSGARSEECWVLRGSEPGLACAEGELPLMRPR